MPDNATCPRCAEPAEVDRRGFFKKFLAVTLGGIVTLVPVAAGLLVFLDPLRRKSASGGFIRVASLDALPSDGVPRKFPIVMGHVDAWNKFSDSPVGAVYLRRVSADRIEAFNVVCPHAGCFVDYKAERKAFLCPCHNSLFALDGKIQNASSPSPRGLDALDVEVRGKEVWVKFQNFRAGTSEKIPVA